MHHQVPVILLLVILGWYVRHMLSRGQLPPDAHGEDRLRRDLRSPRTYRVPSYCLRLGLRGDDSFTDAAAEPVEKRSERRIGSLSSGSGALRVVQNTHTARVSTEHTALGTAN